MAAVTVTWFAVKFFGNLVVDSMTVVAGLPAMLALELVAGVPVVVKNRFIPGSFLVAGCTVLTEAVAMNVPYRMAIDATPGCVLVLLVDVAGVASHAPM